jgi:hypothetical protein
MAFPKIWRRTFIVHCIEVKGASHPRRQRGSLVTAAAYLLFAGGLAALLSGCASSPMPPWPGSQAAAGAPASASGGTASGGAIAARAAPPLAAALATAAQEPAKSWPEYQRRAALRMVAASPEQAYTGPVPEPLLAIPVLEVELRSDGQIARINVVRTPTQAEDTVQIAIEAVQKAAPFGDVRKLPRPWKFVEVFLFNDNRQFKPRSLDD